MRLVEGEDRLVLHGIARGVESSWERERRALLCRIGLQTTLGSINQRRPGEQQQPKPTYTYIFPSLFTPTTLSPSPSAPFGRGLLSAASPLSPTVAHFRCRSLVARTATSTPADVHASIVRPSRVPLPGYALCHRSGTDAPSSPVCGPYAAVSCYRCPPP